MNAPSALARRWASRLAAGAIISSAVIVATTTSGAVSASASTRPAVSATTAGTSATVMHEITLRTILRPDANVWAFGDRIIIDVQTGNMNHSNNTQLVDSITIESATASNDDYGCGLFEAWTQGYYTSSQACGAVFYYINRWVSTGNYVCGAFTAFDTNWPRTIACIGISV
jgi:hypothetical protein